jgi:hypothetical protein
MNTESSILDAGERSARADPKQKGINFLIKRYFTTILFFIL